MARAVRYTRRLSGYTVLAQVPAYGHQDHVSWPAVAREGRGGPKREVASTVCASKALATVAVMAVTRDDELLAVRTGRHAGRHYQHQTTSQTRRGDLVSAFLQ